MGALIPIAIQLAQWAPTLLRFFGAGQGSVDVASKVVDIAQQITGTADPHQAVAAIAANGELQATFQRRVLEVDADLERAYLADRADARARDVALAKAGRHNTRADLMVLFDVVGLVACLVVLGWFRKDILAEVITLVSTIASIFGLCLRDAHQFEFGSSRGSREKDQQMAAKLKTGGPGA